MLPSQASELKQQAILEKARDPNSSVSPEAAKEAIVQEATAAGGAAYNFDPSATKEEKAAQVDSHIPASLKPELGAKGAALPSDADKQPPDYNNLPPPTADGALSPGEIKNDGPGGLQREVEDDDERFWKIAGWAPRFGYAIPPDVDFSKNLADQQTWLEERLHDGLFGDWYHNAGIILFACILSWTIALLGGGLGWLFIVMAFCATYYRTSIRRVRRNFRDDIRREMAKASLEHDTETLEWINSFLVKFWPIYAPVLSKTIVMSVDQVLSVATPPMVESLKLTTFTLGTKPPRLEHVKTYPNSDDDIVLMDWKFSFNPNDTADMTARQLKVKQNPKIVLEVRLGKGVVSKGLDVIVEDMACEGVMRVKVKLQTGFPHVERVEICFLQKPTFDYVCKPLGGDTFGFDINFIPGLEHFIVEQIHASLQPMMYAPNVFPIEIAKMLAGTPMDQAIGVVQISIQGAQGLKNPDQFGSTPDPYAMIKINDRQELGRTKTTKESSNPAWNETFNILITSLKDTVNIHVFDFNEFRKDRELGLTFFPLERLERQCEYENEQLELTWNGKARGLVQADIRYFPVLGPTKLEDGTVQPPPETRTGIIRYEVEQAKELDGTKSLIGILNPYAVLLLNGREVHISEKKKRTNFPVWESAHKELLITDRKTAKLGLVIKDDRDLGTDPVVGSYQIKLEDMLDLAAKGQEWYNLSGVKTGRAKMKIQWRPVDLKGSVLGSEAGYLKPIGVLRLYFQNARDLRNVETVGKSDPYARILLSGVQRARTVTWKNNLNPDFDETLYVPVHTTREKLTIEIMDEEVMARDRSLGHFDILLKDYITEEDGEYLVHDTKEMLSRPLQSGPAHAQKGSVNITCSFFPCIPTIDPDEEEREKELEAVAKKSTEIPRPSTDSATAVSAPKMAREPSQGRPSTSGSASKAAESDAQAVQPPQKPKLRITGDSLVQYGKLTDMSVFSQSGLLVFTILDGDNLRPNCHLEVLMDDMAYPSYSSNKVRSRHHEFNETGDALIRELDASRITLRLLEHTDKEGKGSALNVLAKLSGPTLQTLQRCLYTPTQLSLHDDQGVESKIRVKLKFVPIKMKLDPSESFRNMGQLRVEVLRGTSVPVGDRTGFSDPYCKFKLNDKDVYKTETKKKTLDPVWNETFDVQIRSRTAANFYADVYDWDFGDKDDFLGKATIDLKPLEPYQSKEVVLPLDTTGSITLRLLFTPDYVARQRQGTSTFQGTLMDAGKVAGAPVKTIGRGASVIGGGVVKTGSFLSKSLLRRKSRGANDMEDADESGTATPTETVTPPLPSTPAVPAIPGVDGSDGGNLSVTGIPTNGSMPIASTETGVASLAVISTSGFPPSANIRVHIRQGKNGKEVHKTKAIKSSSGEVKFDHTAEHVRAPCTADTPFRVVVKDHHTLGADEELGDATFYVADQGNGAEQVVRMAKGDGKVVMRSSFEAGDNASISGSAKLSRVFGKRDSRERSVTPGA